MAKQWSQHSSKQQKEHIMNTKPWDKSTGPKSNRGKQQSSRNAYKGKTPLRDIQKMITRVHRERLELTRWLDKEFGIIIKY